MRQGATRAAGVCHAYAAGRAARIAPAVVDTCNEEGLVPHIFGLKIVGPILLNFQSAVALPAGPV